MLSVLIVDDENYVRDGIQRNIHWALFDIQQIYQAKTGSEGLQMAIELQPDLIISDVRMPHMDGLAMATALRKQGSQAHLIFISAFSQLEYYRKAIKLHAVSFIEKPIVLEELEQEISVAAGQIMAERSAVHFSQSEAAGFASCGYRMMRRPNYMTIEALMRASSGSRTLVCPKKERQRWIYSMKRAEQ